MRLALTLGCALALAPALAAADTVHLEGGRVLEGAAAVAGDKVEITLENGRVSVPLSEVERIERATPALAVAEQRERALAPADAAGMLTLANFCREHDLLGKERALLERILGVQPEHAEARRRLGFVRTAEGWVSSAALERQRKIELARTQRDEVQRELSRLELQKKKAELARELDAQRGERAKRRQTLSDGIESQATRGTPPSYPYYVPFDVGLQRGNYGGSRPPPYYVVPQPWPEVSPPSDQNRNYSINGVLEPSSYFEHAFRR